MFKVNLIPKPHQAPWEEILPQAVLYPSSQPAAPHTPRPGAGRWRQIIVSSRAEGEQAQSQCLSALVQDSGAGYAGKPCRSMYLGGGRDL